MAQVRRRFSYRRLHDLLRPEFPNVNYKKIYHLYRQANLAVRRRRKTRRPASERVALSPAHQPNAVWSPVGRHQMARQLLALNGP